MNKSQDLIRSYLSNDSNTCPSKHTLVCFLGMLETGEVTLKDFDDVCLGLADLVLSVRKSNIRSLIYLATPYSHEDPAIRQERFEVVNRVAASLMLAGEHVYSPISHTHPIALAGDLPKCWDFWQEFDRLMLSKCYKMLILRQEGWQESEGVKAERGIARELGIPVEFIDP